MSKNIRRYAYIISAAVIALIVGIMAALGPFYALDSYITDRLYTKLTGTTPDIIIVGVDEETLSAYGNFNLWSRDKSAELLEYLYEDEDNRPAVVGLDFMFVDEYDKAADLRLAEAAKAYNGNVILATNVVYRGALETGSDGKLYYNTENIADFEVPYDALASVAKLGFSNASIASDGCVRNAMNSVRVPDALAGTIPGIESGLHDSFAVAVYKAANAAYGKDEGDTSLLPKTNSRGLYRFMYSGKVGEFQHVSMQAVLSGNVPKEAFKNKIVLVGAYAPGFQDAYKPAIDRGRSMYGVEIHANIIQAMMQHKTGLPMGRAAIMIITCAIALVFLVLSKKQKLSVILISSAVVAALYCVAGRILAGKGTFIPVAYILLFLIGADIYFIIEKYVLERIRRKHTLDVFKKYVAPEVVDNLSKTGDFELHLGGEKRDVAVLFVDIRGFTPLSEGLQPETVVAILNEYLALTTKSILAHKGTLDKFVGDATMAVFNAPFDQDDYIYEAVAAAWDMKCGSKELGERLYKEYGKTVGFGVGVNCGVAVVGNIGCDFRMDYTAIGDTVNTAARLEANAKTEQILISEDVYEKIKDRIEATPIGEIPLKGKSNKIMVYSVDSIGGKALDEGQMVDNT